MEVPCKRVTNLRIDRTYLVCSYTVVQRPVDALAGQCPSEEIRKSRLECYE